MTSRDFLRAASARLTTADFLARIDYTLDAMYLTGYSVECSLKALILHLTSRLGEAESIGEEGLGRAEIERRIVSGSSMHNPDVLDRILRELGRPIPLRLKKRIRVYRWSTSLRYESGRKRTGDVRGFIKVARDIYRWVEDELR